MHLSTSWGFEEVVVPNLLMLDSARRTTSTFSISFRRLVSWKLQWLPGPSVQVIYWSDSFCSRSQMVVKFRKTTGQGQPSKWQMGQILPVCTTYRQVQGEVSFSLHSFTLEQTHCSKGVHKPWADNAELKASPWTFPASSQPVWAVKVEDRVFFPLPQALRHSTWPTTSSSSVMTCAEGKRHCWDGRFSGRILVLSWSPEKRSWKEGSDTLSTCHFSPGTRTYTLIYYLGRKFRDIYLPKMSL